MARGRPPKSQKPRPTTSVRLSERDRWCIEALIEQDYGEDATDIIRQALRMFVRQAQRDGRLPQIPMRSVTDIPPPDGDDNGRT
jgi:Arc/MetJ-type ribon-helix-helix transcriptional regulator